MTADIELRFRPAQWNHLTGHLFPGDGDEHGAALLCGAVRTDRGLRLVVREVVPAIDGVDYVPGMRGYRHLNGAFVTRQLRRAKDLGLVYLAAHNHGGEGHVAFSRSDLDSHERAYPTLLGVNGEAVGGLVLSRRAVTGDIWLPDGTRADLAVTSVVGDALDRRTDNGAIYGGASASRTATRDATFARQALIFGPVGQELLREMRVGIVGAGGVGMLIVQALSRLGVGQFVVADPDHVSLSNLPRLPEARTRDATGWLGNGVVGRIGRRLGLNRPTNKVDLARRIIAHANPQAQVNAVCGDIADDPVARQLRSCDFIFLAADTMLARDVVNQIAYQYLIPTLQVGSKVVLNPATGAVTDIFGVVRSLGTAPGCMRCNGLVNVAKLTEEAVATEEQRRNQRYIDDPDVDAPSVITINAMSVGWAVNDFMHYATGLGRPSTGFRLLRSRPVAPSGLQLTLQAPDADPDCHVCGDKPYSALSRGDAIELPTRITR
jgi:Dinucleotide-utilizing enzymes involved in molybdopterin and thiamine biosynthesis family 2